METKRLDDKGGIPHYICSAAEADEAQVIEGVLKLVEMTAERSGIDSFLPLTPQGYIVRSADPEQIIAALEQFAAHSFEQPAEDNNIHRELGQRALKMAAEIRDSLAAEARQFDIQASDFSRQLDEGFPS